MIEPRSLRALVALCRRRTAPFLSTMRLLDPQCFVHSCERHQLAGYVYLLLQELEIANEFSPDFIRQLRAAYLRQWSRAETLRRALLELAKRFEAEGEVFILLKGFHFADHFYNDSDSRTMNDLDLLVRRSCFKRCRELLVEAGYRLVTDSTLPTELLLGFIHHLEFEKSGTGRDSVPLDLHHQIRTHPSLGIKEDDLWSSHQTMEIAGLSLPVLSDPNSLLVAILTIHADIGLGTITLRPLVDLLRILERVGNETAWDSFLEQRRAERTAKICLNVLALFLAVFECKDRFPTLTYQIRQRIDQQVAPIEREFYLQLLSGATLDRKKRWAFECYQYPLWRSAGWWLASLPVQLAAYRKTFFRDLGGRLRGDRLSEPNGAEPSSLGAASMGQEPTGKAPDNPNQDSGTRSEYSPPVQQVAPTTTDRQTALAAPDLGTFGPAAFGLTTEDFRVALSRFGSLTTHFFASHPRYRQIIEELFRIEMEEITDDTVPDANIYIFETDLEQLRNYTPAPLAPVVKSVTGDVIEIHHQIASAFLFMNRNPVEVQLAIRPAAVSEDDHLQDHLLHSVMIAFYKTLWTLGRVQLHAAAIEIGGVAHIFVGDRGAGKSTVSLRLGRSGGIVLGEDHIMLRQLAVGLARGRLEKTGRAGDSLAGSSFAVSGCDPNMRLTAKTESHFFHEELSEPQRDYAGVLKKEVKARRFLDSQPYRDVPVGKLFFSRVGEKFEIELLPRSQALIRLLDGIRDRHRFAGRDDRADFLDFFANFVEETECFNLTLSPNLEDLDQLASFLTRP